MTSEFCNVTVYPYDETFLITVKTLFARSTNPNPACQRSEHAGLLDGANQSSEASARRGTHRAGFEPREPPVNAGGFIGSRRVARSRRWDAWVARLVG